MTTWWDEQDEQRQAKISAVLDTDRGRQCRSFAGDDRGFAAWLLVAELTCRRRYGLSIFDLADWAWRVAYDDDQTPAAALLDALAADAIGALLLRDQQ